MPCWNLPVPDWWKWNSLRPADLPAGKPAAQNSFLPQITITLRDCVISIGETAPPELISSVLEAVRHA